MSSSLFITLIALGIIGGLAFFVSAGFRGSGKAVDLAPNLSKYRNDDDLETKTLDRTLTVAVLLASLLTIMIPLYYLGEQNRQDEFAVEFDEVSVERGEHLYESLDVEIVTEQMALEEQLLTLKKEVELVLHGKHQQ